MLRSGVCRTGTGSLQIAQPNGLAMILPEMSVMKQSAHRSRDELCRTEFGQFTHVFVAESGVRRNSACSGRIAKGGWGPCAEPSVRTADGRRVCGSSAGWFLRRSSSSEYFRKGQGRRVGLLFFEASFRDDILSVGNISSVSRYVCCLIGKICCCRYLSAMLP